MPRLRAVHTIVNLVTTRGALSKPSTRSGGAASFAIQLSSGSAASKDD